MVVTSGKGRNGVSDDGEKGLKGIPSNSPQGTTNGKINGILNGNKNKESITDYIDFRDKASQELGRIINSLFYKMSKEQADEWHINHIEMLQNILKKIFPNDYKKVLTWYCLSGVTPIYSDIVQCDFPGFYSVMNFLSKFKIEIDKMQDKK